MAEALANKNETLAPGSVSLVAVAIQRAVVQTGPVGEPEPYGGPAEQSSVQSAKSLLAVALKMTPPSSGAGPPVTPSAKALPAAAQEKQHQPPGKRGRRSWTTVVERRHFRGGRVTERFVASGAA